jgi:hypothetical protein
MHNMRCLAPFQLAYFVPSVRVAANDARLVLGQVLKQVGMHRFQMRRIEAAQ